MKKYGTMCLRQLDLRAYIHKRLSKVCRWEILTVASAEAVVIS